MTAPSLVLEQVVQQIQDLIPAEHFNAAGELDAFVRGLMAAGTLLLFRDGAAARPDVRGRTGRKMPQSASLDALYAAQDLIYAAWEAPTRKKAVRLATSGALSRRARPCAHDSALPVRCACSAIAHLKDLLRLNPNDNQGVRYIHTCWAPRICPAGCPTSAHWATLRRRSCIRRRQNHCGSGCRAQSSRCRKRPRDE